MSELEVDTAQFTDTSAQSIIESLPFAAARGPRRRRRRSPSRSGSPAGAAASGPCTSRTAPVDVARGLRRARRRPLHRRRARLVRRRARLVDAPRRDQARPDDQGGRARRDRPLLPPGGAQAPSVGRFRRRRTDPERKATVISFGPTRRAGARRETLHEFAADALRPAARECDESEKLPEDVLAAGLGARTSSRRSSPRPTAAPARRARRSRTRSCSRSSPGATPRSRVARSRPGRVRVRGARPGHRGAEASALLPLFCGDRFHAASLASSSPARPSTPARSRTRRRAEGRRLRALGREELRAARRPREPLPRDRAQRRRRRRGRLDAFIVPRDAAGLRVRAPRRTSACARSRPRTLELERVELPAPRRGSAATPAATCGASQPLARRARAACWSASRAP